MKNRIITTFVAALSIINCMAQDRVDGQPAQLSYKSKEIKSALYWEQNSRTGKWESRKNNKLVYLGEGVVVDNFQSLFIGDYAGHRYLFLDYMKYSWRYPALEKEWIYSRTLMQALLSEEDYRQLSSINTGETVVIMPRFYTEMFKGHREYSFPFFLELGETLRSASETLYKSYEKSYSTDFAERMYIKDYPPITLITVKRVQSSDGSDIVRFRVYPHSMKELIDKFYFEVSYSTYQNLFTEDKKKTYK